MFSAHKPAHSPSFPTSPQGLINSRFPGHGDQCELPSLWALTSEITCPPTCPPISGLRKGFPFLEQSQALVLQTRLPLPEGSNPNSSHLRDTSYSTHCFFSVPSHLGTSQDTTTVAITCSQKSCSWKSKALKLHPLIPGPTLLCSTRPWPPPPLGRLHPHRPPLAFTPDSASYAGS